MPWCKLTDLTTERWDSHYIGILISPDVICYRIEKTCLCARKDYKRSDSYVNFFDGNLPSNQWETSLYKTTRSKAHNFNTILDFNLDDKNKVSFSSNIIYNPSKSIENKVNTDVLSAEDTKESSFNTNSDIDIDNTNITLNATYNREIGKNGTHLDIQTNYVYYNEGENQILATDYFDENDSYQYTNAFDTEASQKNNIFTGQIDFSSPLGVNNLELIIPKIKKIIDKTNDHNLISSSYFKGHKATIKNTTKNTNPKLLFDEIFILEFDVIIIN